MSVCKAVAVFAPNTQHGTTNGFDSKDSENTRETFCNTFGSNICALMGAVAQWRGCAVDPCAQLLFLGGFRHTVALVVFVL